MIVSINQPAYLPWLGYFHRIAVSDLHIVLDHVQFEKNSFTNRNKIRTKDGWCWLTVPLKTKGRFGDLAISALETANDSRWNEKHFTALRINYSRTPFYAAHEPFLRRFYEAPHSSFMEMTNTLTEYLLQAFAIKTPLVFSSSMNIYAKKDELVLDLCKAAGAKCYLSGPLGRNYLREELFQEAGIKVIYQDYQHPVYRQSFSDFVPSMAAIDALFNHGPDTAQILMEGNPTKGDVAARSLS